MRRSPGLPRQFLNQCLELGCRTSLTSMLPCLGLTIPLLGSRGSSSGTLSLRDNKDGHPHSFLIEAWKGRLPSCPPRS
jgi:hypothetical protein